MTLVLDREAPGKARTILDLPAGIVLADPQNDLLCASVSIAPALLGTAAAYPAMSAASIYTRDCC
jgi:hypothetical protein